MKSRMTKTEKAFVLANYDAFKAGLLSTADAQRYLRLVIGKTF